MTTIGIANANRRRGKLFSILFPAPGVRFSIALALTFFPYGFLYPLEYPAPELIMMSAWVWAFPSTVGYIAFALAPFIPTQLYGYYAFNLFCVVANLAIVYNASTSDQWDQLDTSKIHKFARACMLVTLAIAALQIFTDQYAWMTVFPHMSLEPGRGAGLRLEPSQFSSLLCLYLVSLISRREKSNPGTSIKRMRRSLRNEAILISLLAILETRSITVLIIAVCFFPAFLSIRGRHLIATALAAVVGFAVVHSVLGSRVDDAIQTSGGSLTEFMTTSLSSWRNTPDVLILMSPGDFLTPGNPTEVRLKIHDHAVLISPLLGWIQNTFTLFSASAITTGLPFTVVAFLGGLVFGMKKLKGAPQLKVVWFLIYLAGWFIMAKWDTTCWVVLGMLPLIHRLSQVPKRTANGKLVSPRNVSARTSDRQDLCMS